VLASIILNGFTKFIKSKNIWTLIIAWGVTVLFLLTVLPDIISKGALTQTDAYILVLPGIFFIVSMIKTVVWFLPKKNNDDNSTQETQDYSEQ
jgi:Na+-transporting NADH:ubiquinone oxidoreductase subunit NqrD